MFVQYAICITVYGILKLAMSFISAFKGTNRRVLSTDSCGSQLVADMELWNNTYCILLIKNDVIIIQDKAEA